MALNIRVAVLAGALVSTTMLATPAAAAAPLAGDLSLGRPAAAFDLSRPDMAAETADWRRCRWNCGWGGGWGGRRGWRRDRIDAGDVLIGAAIIGGVAAILGSNNRRRERERDVVIVERDRDFRDRDADFREAPRDSRRDGSRGSPRGTGSAGLDNAVDMCLARIERDVRVDTVDNVQRTGAGWQVTGSLFNGAGFNCRIGNSGQIEAIDYDGTFGAGDWRDDRSAADAPRAAPGQWDDSRYASARASLGGTVRPDMAVQEADMRAPVAVPARSAAATAMPAYPGGPIPGEVIPETIDEDVGG
jgi:hypothetical protein